MGKPDGLYSAVQLQGELRKDFSSEKDLILFIERNIENVCLDLGYKYKSHVREYPLQKWKKRSKGSKRIDFLIITQCGQRIGIECKNPTYNCELVAGVGQIMSYIALGEMNGVPINRFFLISSALDHIVPMVLSRFNIPITFIAMDKTKYLTWQPR